LMRCPGASCVGASSGTKGCFEILRNPRSKKEVVYLLVSMVPPGRAVTYRALAEIAATSPRAIGSMMRSNECLVIVPCHRVVGMDGLGGFSRGLELKKRLLELEGWRGERISSAAEFWMMVEAEGSLVEVDEEDLWG